MNVRYWPVVARRNRPLRVDRGQSSPPAFDPELPSGSEGNGDKPSLAPEYFSYGNLPILENLMLFRFIALSREVCHLTSQCRRQYCFALPIEVERITKERLFEGY